jgi:exosortase/archaeosortase family protein
MSTRRKKAGKLRIRNDDLKRVLKFLILFNLFAIPLYIIILLNLKFIPLMQLTGGLAVGGLRIASIQAVQSGDFITIPVQDGQWAGYIDWDCTAWKSMLAFFALVFATDFSLRKKLKCMLFIPVIYMLNIFRIIFMFWFVSSYGTANYELVHATIWSWGMLLAVLALWVLCILKVR